jgi:2,4-dienoyl-CoA reductase-like NADH-dependent reductase (Old Yellow Enzyme family)
MTNKQSPGGSLSADELRWLRLRAEGGFGVVMTCAASVHKSGRAWDGQLRIENEVEQKALSALAPVCKNSGALSIVQIHHGGVASPRTLTGQQPISASTACVESVHAEQPRAATSDELLETVTAFDAAAKRVVQAGLDGVEIHGANGYLITQFLSTFFNTRNDEWGGTREKRGKLLFDIAQRCRKSLGPNKILGVRLSPVSSPSCPGIDLKDMLWTAQQLCDLGVDYIHLSLWDAFQTMPETGGTITEYFRKHLPKEVALMGAGKITSPDSASQYLKQGADFAALGKVAIGNPDWPRLAQADAGYRPDEFPMSRELLMERGLSAAFVEYLRQFKQIALVK